MIIHPREITSILALILAPVRRRRLACDTKGTPIKLQLSSPHGRTALPSFFNHI